MAGPRPHRVRSIERSYHGHSILDHVADFRRTGGGWWRRLGYRRCATKFISVFCRWRRHLAVRIESSKQYECGQHDISDVCHVYLPRAHHVPREAFNNVYVDCWLDGQARSVHDHVRRAGLCTRGMLRSATNGKSVCFRVALN
jgi:hypothetical protein